MRSKIWFNLQLFAEGASGGATGATSGDNGGATNTGENATAAAEQRLRDLGVPEEKIRKRASKVAARMGEVSATPAPAIEDTKKQTAPAEEESPTEDTKESAPARMSWDEIMKDPEYNKRMQEVVSSRLRASKGAEEALSKLTPALEILARKYDMDIAKINYDELAQKVSNDNSYYEDKALEMGVSVETAKKLDQMERNTEREKAIAARNLEEQKLRNHYAGLEKQAAELKTLYPQFDLMAELNNPAFARMTAPNVGISVKDAYHAIHHDEIHAAAMQVAAQQTAEKISNSIQANSRRPDESGASSQAASVNTFNYRNASREQREALKKQIRDAAARGEKLYPGR